MRSPIVALLVAASLLAGCSTHPEASSGPAEWKTEIVSRSPGDPKAFTQGFEVARDNPNEFIVGTGWYGESLIQRRTIDGAVLASEPLQPTEFGEGIAQLDDAIWQLTWTNGVAYKRDSHTLKVIGQATYPGEGWGLCALGSDLIMSDGTSQLRIVDPATFAERGRVETGVDKLNELECADGAIYANRFMTTEIVKIGRDGALLARIDASGLANNATKDPNHVLNGIAKKPGSDTFYLTGKRWPDVYEVRFVPAH